MHVASVDGVEVHARTTCSLAISFFDKIPEVMGQWMCQVEYVTFENKILAGQMWLLVIPNAKNIKEGDFVTVRPYTKKAIARHEAAVAGMARERSRSPRGKASAKPFAAKAAAAKKVAAKAKAKK